MIIDNELVFSALTGQAVTAAADATNTLDLQVVNSKIGTGENLYLVVGVATALTDGGSNTGTVVTFVEDSTTTITPDATVQTVGTFAQAAAAGTVLIARVQPGQNTRRYATVHYAPAGANLTGGAFYAFLTTNIDAYTAYPKSTGAVIDLT